MSVKVVSVKTDVAIVCASRVRGSVRQAFIDALTDKMAAEITLPTRWEARDYSFVMPCALCHCDWSLRCDGVAAHGLCVDVRRHGKEALSCASPVCKRFLAFESASSAVKCAFLISGFAAPLLKNWGVVRGVSSPLVFIYPPDKNPKNLI